MPPEETDPPPFDVTAEIRAAVVDEKVLDGVSLVTRGPTEVCRQPAVPLPVVYALLLTPELLESDDCHRLQSYKDVWTALSPRLPRAVVWAAAPMERSWRSKTCYIRVDAAIEPDWTTLECARADSWSKDVHLVRTPVVGRHCTQTLTELRPEVLIGNACRRYDPLRRGHTAAT